MSEQTKRMSDESALSSQTDSYSAPPMAEGGMVKMAIPPGAKFCPHCGKPLKGKKE